MDKLLYTPDDAAERLSISRSKLYELLGTGELDSAHIGASRRIPAACLHDYVAQLHRRDEPSDGEAA